MQQIVFFTSLIGRWAIVWNIPHLDPFGTRTCDEVSTGKVGITWHPSPGIECSLCPCHIWENTVQAWCSDCMVLLELRQIFLEFKEWVVDVARSLSAANGIQDGTHRWDTFFKSWIFVLIIVPARGDTPARRQIPPARDLPPIVGRD